MLLHMRISHLLVVDRLLRGLSIFGCKNALNFCSDFVVNDGLIVFTNDINAEFLVGGQSHEEQRRICGGESQLSTTGCDGLLRSSPAAVLCRMNMVAGMTR